MTADRDTPAAALADWLDRPSDEIWEPPGMPRFKPGDRVAVRVNLECVYCLDPKFPKCYERALSDDGRTATVYDVGHSGCCGGCEDAVRATSHRGHTVWVTWDERRPYDDAALEGVPFDAHFAPSELTLLSAAVAPGHGEEEAG